VSSVEAAGKLVAVAYTKTVLLPPEVISRLPLLRLCTEGQWKEASESKISIDLNQVGCEAVGLEAVLQFAQQGEMRLTPANVLSALKAADYIGSQEAIEYIGADFPRLVRTMGSDLFPLVDWLLAHPRLHDHSIILTATEHIARNVWYVEPTLWVTLPRPFVAGVLTRSNLPMHEYRTFTLLKSIFNTRQAADLDSAFVGDLMAQLDISQFARQELEIVCSDLLRTSGSQYSRKIPRLERVLTASETRLVTVPATDILRGSFTFDGIWPTQCMGAWHLKLHFEFQRGIPYCPTFSCTPTAPDPYGIYLARPSIFPHPAHCDMLVEVTAEHWVLRRSPRGAPTMLQHLELD